MSRAFFLLATVFLYAAISSAQDDQDKPPPVPKAIDCYGEDCAKRVRVPKQGFFPTRKPNLTKLKSKARVGQHFRCEVGFSVSLRGRAQNIVPACLDPAFEQGAMEMVQALEFAPLIIRGRAYERSAIDCCIAGNREYYSNDTFFCIKDKKEDVSVCEIALKATQD